MIGNFVTAKLLNKDDTRQGWLISTRPLRIRGQSGKIYLCEGIPVLVTNPPDDPSVLDDQTAKCPTCGYQYIRGTDSPHSCADAIRKELASIKEQFHKLFEACGHLCDEDCVYSVLDLEDDLRGLNEIFREG